MILTLCSVWRVEKNMICKHWWSHHKKTIYYCSPFLVLVVRWFAGVSVYRVTRYKEPSWFKTKGPHLFRQACHFQYLLVWEKIFCIVLVAMHIGRGWHRQFLSWGSRAGVSGANVLRRLPTGLKPRQSALSVGNIVFQKHILIVRTRRFQVLQGMSVCKHFARMSVCTTVRTALPLPG